MNAVLCEQLSCTRPADHPSGPVEVRNFSTEIRAGEFVGFCGPDGCGKGLLLNTIGLIERSCGGLLELAGTEATGMSDEEAATLRNEICGFLFAHPYLLPSFTVAENVAVPLFRICGGEAVEARQRTLEVLEFSGIAGLETPLAGRLDSSLRWRAAFARSLVHNPAVLIAISTPAPHLLPLARRAADEMGVAVLWAGEREMLEPFSDRIIELREGRVINP